MKKSLVIVLAIAFHAVLHGQTKLYEGTVIDAEYFTPVAYAAVYIQNTRYGTARTTWVSSRSRLPTR